VSTPVLLLFVDKSRAFLDKTSEVVAGAGYSMLSAIDGGEARELLVRRRPHVVFVSARLQGETGYDICRFAKAYDPVTPVVLMFHREDGRSTSMQVDTEADNYVVRPLKKSELLVCIRDMLRIRRLHEEAARQRTEIERLKGRDRLTGPIGEPFYPFDVFRKLAFVELKRAKRHRLPLSALLLSIDGLDALLAAYGNETVTRLRDAVAQAIRRSVRETDLPVSLRLGSLLLLMPHTDGAGAKIVAERIQQRIRRATFRHEGELIRSTLSIGGTIRRAGAETSFADMIHSASKALLEAQRAGGDRLVLSK
jgi:diguanylate cyclase (GGDEF)-like protein